MHTLRHAFRTVTKTPWLSAVVILSLAIGIGTNTVIFSWLKAQVFEPLPGVSAPVWSLETRDDTGNYVSTSWLEYRDLREMVSSFEGIAAQRPRAFYLGDSERDARIFGEFVSENFFEVLGVHPALGRFSGRRKALDRGRNRSPSFRTTSGSFISKARRRSLVKRSSSTTAP